MLERNVETTVGDQVTEETVYPVPEFPVETGVAPVAGWVTPVMVDAVMVVAVAGNKAETTPEPAALVAVAPATVK